MIYLDNAATSYRKSQDVIDAVNKALCGMGNPGRGVNTASLEASRVVYETRCLLSEMFGGYGPSRVAFTSNSTEALNTAIMGSFVPGDHVITTVLEHNSVLRPLYRLESAGVELTILDCDEKGNVDSEAFATAVRSNTRGIVCTHASNLTGNMIDIKRVGEIAGERGLRFIVDASQSAGVFDIDMKEMNIDILCVTGHKSLMGPQGTGAILVRDGIKVEPLKVGGSGIHTFDKEHPSEMPTALEAGTLNAHGIAGLNAALKYIQKTGVGNIRNRELEHASKFYNGISDIPNLKFYGDYSAGMRAPIVTFNIGDYDSGLVSDTLLTEYDIQTRSGGHCAPLMHEAFGTQKQGAVRFSFNWFNTDEEIETAIRAVRELTGEN